VLNIHLATSPGVFTKFSLLCKQQTRGLRIAELAGSDAEDDEEFWGHDTWAESEDDEQYSTEEG